MPSQERMPWITLITASILATLSGCASQQTITEQTAPLRQQIGQVEASTAALTRTTQEQVAAAHAREAALTQRIEGLRAELLALQAKFDELSTRTGSLTERSNQAELRIDEQATLNREATEQIEAIQEQAAKAELRLDELATNARDSEAAIDLLSEHQGQTDLRLDEAMTLAREAHDTLDQAPAK